MNLGSETLAIHNIKITAKLANVTYWAKSKDRLKGMKKDRKALKKLNLLIQLNGNSLMAQPNRLPRKINSKRNPFCIW